MASVDDQYGAILRTILEHGDVRTERTGVGTRSIFGVTARFDLSNGEVPVVSGKRVAWKLAVKEMLWFLTGSTNIRPLVTSKVGIWTDWPLARYRAETGTDIDQAEFERKIVADEAFAARWGELGPVYGKQWRRWDDGKGGVIDQVATVIRLLREAPTSRRILFHGWNVVDLPEMALPPCHMVYQFFVRDGKLSCLLFQRSADHFLGTPFNWVGASALMLMLAQQAGLTPGELIWNGGDVHLYLNHVEQAHELLSRSPRPAPRLRLIRHAASIDDYRIEDFELTGYDPHPAIKADVAV